MQCSFLSNEGLTTAALGWAMTWRWTQAVQAQPVGVVEASAIGDDASAAPAAVVLVPAPTAGEGGRGGQGHSRLLQLQ